jgi:hypothetical protein
MQQNIPRVVENFYMVKDFNLKLKGALKLGFIKFTLGHCQVMLQLPCEPQQSTSTNASLFIPGKQILEIHMNS